MANLISWDNCRWNSSELEWKLALTFHSLALVAGRTCLPSLMQYFFNLPFRHKSWQISWTRSADSRVGLFSWALVRYEQKMNSRIIINDHDRTSRVIRVYFFNSLRFHTHLFFFVITLPFVKRSKGSIVRRNYGNKHVYIYVFEQSFFPRPDHLYSFLTAISAIRTSQRARGGKLSSPDPLHTLIICISERGRAVDVVILYI